MTNKKRVIALEREVVRERERDLNAWHSRTTKTSERLQTGQLCGRRQVVR